MPSFKIIGLLALEKNIFKVFAIYSNGSHLGHVTLAIYINFHSSFPRMLHMTFGFDGLLPLMLHTKFQNHRPSVSRSGEDFLKAFAINSHGGHLGHVILTIYYSLNPSMYFSIAITVMEKVHIDIHPRKKEVRF